MELNQKQEKYIATLQVILRVTGHLIIAGILLINFLQMVSPELGMMDLVVLLAGCAVICSAYLFKLPKIRQLVLKREPAEMPTVAAIKEEKSIPVIIARWLCWVVGAGFLLTALADIAEYSIYENVDAWVALALGMVLGLLGLLVYLPACKKILFYLLNLKSDGVEMPGGKAASFLRGLFGTLFSVVVLCLLGWMVYLAANQVYRATLVEPQFVIRLFRALVLGYVVLLILRIPNVVEKIKAWKVQDADLMKAIWRGMRMPVFIGMALIVLVAGAEIGARIAYRDQLKPYDGDIFVGSRTEDLFSHDAVTSETMQAFNIDHPDGIEYYFTKDFTGEYFNSTDGFRLTVNQPGVYKNTIYVIGASYVQSLDTPDDLTLPSHLQNMINEQYGDDYRVVNWGTFSHSCESYYFKIHDLALKQGDVVLVLLGNADINRIYINDPYDWFWPVVGVSNAEEISKKVTRVENPYDVFNHPLPASPSAFFRFVLQPALPYKPENYKSLATYQFALDNTVQVCAEVLKETQGYLQEAGVDMISFVEPNLFTLAEPSERELAMLNDTGLSPYGMKFVSTRFLTAFSALEPELKASGVTLVDLTSAFDGRSEGTEVYHNWNNINSIGNALLAEEIMQALAALLP